MIIKLEGIKLIRGASCDLYAQQLAQRRNSLSRDLNVQVRVDGSKLSLCAEERSSHLRRPSVNLWVKLTYR